MYKGNIVITSLAKSNAVTSSKARNTCCKQRDNVPVIAYVLYLKEHRAREIIF